MLPIENKIVALVGKIYAKFEFINKLIDEFVLDAEANKLSNIRMLELGNSTELTIVGLLDCLLTKNYTDSTNSKLFQYQTQRKTLYRDHSGEFSAIIDVTQLMKYDLKSKTWGKPPSSLPPTKQRFGIIKDAFELIDTP